MEVVGNMGNGMFNVEERTPFVVDRVAIDEVNALRISLFGDLYSDEIDKIALTVTQHLDALVNPFKALLVDMSMADGFDIKGKRLFGLLAHFGKKLKEENPNARLVIYLKPEHVQYFYDLLTITLLHEELFQLIKSPYTSQAYLEDTIDITLPPSRDVELPRI